MIAIAFVMSGCRVRREHAEPGPTPIVSLSPIPIPLPRTDLVPIAMPTTSLRDTERLARSEGILVLAMGGLHSPADDPTPEVRAVERALSVLDLGGDPLDAAAAGVSVLEDSGLRNAGHGSSFRLDGKTVEADAAVADSTGRFGAVAAVAGLRNPVFAARVVADMQSFVLAGARAADLALWLGLEPALPPPASSAEEFRTALRAAMDPSVTDSAPIYFEHYADLSLLEELPSTDSDTDRAVATTERQEVRPNSAADSVAVLIRGRDGRFAGAMSAGGPVLSLPGRVGDVPVPGAALYCGARGVVAVDGDAERIVMEQLARRVYEELARAGSTKTAAELGRKLMEPNSIAIAIVGQAGLFVDPPNSMAFASFDSGRIATSREEADP